jgi:hypothetical protein
MLNSNVSAGKTIFAAWLTKISNSYEAITSLGHDREQKYFTKLNSQTS